MRERSKDELPDTLRLVRQAPRYEDDQAVMPVTIYHRRGKGAMDAKWAEETCVTRHFCARPKAGGDGPSTTASAAMTGPSPRSRAPPSAIPGSAWNGGSCRSTRARGADAGAPARAPGVPAPPLTDPGQVVTFAGTRVIRELHELAQDVAEQAPRVLPRAGIVSLDQVAAMTDEQLLAIDGIGKGMLARLREAVAARKPDDGTTLARKVYELLQAGLPHLGDEDPMRDVLAETMPSLAAALSQPA